VVQEASPVQLTGIPYHRLMLNPGHAWWRPVFGALMIITGWVLATIIALLPAQILNPDAEGTVSWSTLLATNVSLAALVPICIVVYHRMHRLRPGLLSSVRPGLRWRPLAWFAVIAFACELGLLTFALLMPAELETELSGPASDAAAVIVVTLLTSCFQAAGEEYLFRGYLLQALGAVTRTIWFPIITSAVLFTLAHGVWPWESPALFADRFAFGVVAGYLVIRTGGLEAGIAMHAANNVVTFVFAAMTNSVSDSLQATDAPVALVIVDVFKFTVFGVIALWLAKRRHLKAHADPALLAPEPVSPPPGWPPAVPPGQAPGYGAARPQDG
jgi:membrane protease YdiL (CAAX protease family)